MDSPITEETDLVSYSVLAGGSEIDSTYQVTRIWVHKELNKVSTAKLTLLDGSASQEKFVISNTSDFVPGTEIEIKAGYHSKDVTIFKGIVTKQRVKAGPGVGSTLEVVCRDKAIKSTVARKNAYYQDTTDSDALNKALGSYGLTLSVDSTTPQLKEIIQSYATDWDFALTRAEVNGLVAVVDDGKLSIKKPELSGSASLGVSYGNEILDLDSELDSTTQLPSVTCNAWDMSSQAMVNSDSSEPSVNSQGNITGKKLSDVLGLSEYNLQSTGAVAKDSLKAWADGRLLKSRLSRLRGTVSFQGNSTVKPDTLLNIDGVGDRFDGDAYITAVEQTIESGNWVTRATFGLSDTWFANLPDIVAPTASGIIPGIEGLYTGVVKQIDSDPDNEFRVLVTIPVIQSSDDGVWARLSNFYATKGAGQYFYPEVGDEVVLGFLNADPSFPVILGSLYSSSIAAPFTPDENNYTKAIVTKEKMKITFDEENKVITIETPGGNKVTISDEDKGITLEDQNSNKVQLNDSGITLDSPKDINIKGGSSVSIKGPNITVQADSALDLKGANVTASADASMTVKGSASTEVSSSGQTSVKGSMVMIN